MGKGRRGNNFEGVLTAKGFPLEFYVGKNRWLSVAEGVIRGKLIYEKTLWEKKPISGGKRVEVLGKNGSGKGQRGYMESNTQSKEYYVSEGWGPGKN